MKNLIVLLLVAFFMVACAEDNNQREVISGGVDEKGVEEVSFETRTITFHIGDEPTGSMNKVMKTSITYDNILDSINEVCLNVYDHNYELINANTYDCSEVADKQYLPIDYEFQNEGIYYTSLVGLDYSEERADSARIVIDTTRKTEDVYMGSLMPRTYIGKFLSIYNIYEKPETISIVYEGTYGKESINSYTDLFSTHSYGTSYDIYNTFSLSPNHVYLYLCINGVCGDLTGIDLMGEYIDFSSLEKISMIPVSDCSVKYNEDTIRETKSMSSNSFEIWCPSSSPVDSVLINLPSYSNIIKRGDISFIDYLPGEKENLHIAYVRTEETLLNTSYSPVATFTFISDGKILKTIEIKLTKFYFVESDFKGECDLMAYFMGFCWDYKEVNLDSID